MPAGRIMVLTTSPFRSVNCWPAPETPARTSVLSSSTIDHTGQTFDLAPSNGIGFQELGLHFVLVNSHLKETLCLTDLCGCCRKLRLSLLCFSLEFFNLPTRRLHGCFLL